MFYIYAFKSLLRRRFSSVLLVFILSLTSVLLCLSLALSYAADVICQNLDDFYTTLAILQPAPTTDAYPEKEDYRAAYQAYFTLIKNIIDESIDLNYVKMIDRRFTALGVAEGVKTVTLGFEMGTYVNNRAYDAPNNYAILVVEKITEAEPPPESIDATYRITDIVTMNETYSYPDDVQLILPAWIRDLDWRVGEKFLLCCQYDEKSLAGDIYEDIVYVTAGGSRTETKTENGLVVYEYDSMTTLVDGVRVQHSYPIMTRLDMPLSDFWESEQGKEWLATTVPYVSLCADALLVTATDNVKSVQYFNIGKARLSEGRYITEEEYESGAQVCMVSTSLAELNGWAVGDQIQMDMYDASGSQIEVFGLGAGYSPLQYQPIYRGTVQEQNTYTVVGLYRTESLVEDDQYYISPNTVFVPKMSLHGEYSSFGDTHANKLSIVLYNHEMAAFQQEAEALGYGEFFTYNDQGYSAIADMLLAVQASSVTIRNMCLGLWVFSVALAVFLFFLMQRKYAATMYRLGCRKRNIFVYVLTQLGVMGVIAAVLGFLGSNALYDRVLSWMLQGDIRLFDESFSALSTGEATAEEVMGYLAQSPEAFASIIGVQFAVIAAVFVLSSLVFALRRHRNRA